MNGRFADDALGRGSAAAIVSLFGVAFAVPNLLRLASLEGPTSALVLAGVGTVLALVLIAAGALLARAGFTPEHTLRIAGWATLGTAVLGLVLALVAVSGADLPLYGILTVLSVSTFAHVVIGVRDVQRIRATELARQREQLAVLNRLVRHNLRHEAQLLLGTAARIPDAEDREARGAVADDVEATAETLSEMHDRLDRSQALLGRTENRSTAVDLGAIVEAVAAEHRADYPDATVAVDVPADLRVAAGDDLRPAIAELVENAIVHGNGSPRVEIEAVEMDGRVTVEVRDDGPGIPEPERAVVSREADIDQLTHGQGLGLWLVRWVMDAYDGRLAIDGEDGGTTVRLELPRARV
jgi:signal transduction histidine kinase